MKYASLCSGIEAASLAWEPLGWEPAWFAEIEPFPCAVLAHHWPQVPNYGDMTKLIGRILLGEIEAPDILVAGTPCQAFSVAGLRGSLDDDRGNLTLVMIRIYDAINFIRGRQGKPPAILVWENVPGVLNTKDNAFGCLLGGLAGEDLPLQPAGQKWTNAGAVLGRQTEIAWRILDAQYFGVPQRRRRVFLVAGARGCHATKILFERQSQSRNIEAGGTTQQDVTAYVESSFGGYRSSGIAGTLRARGGCLDGGSESLIVVNGRQTPVVSRGIAVTLDTRFNTNVVCINGNIINKSEHSGGNGMGAIQDGTCYTLTSTDRHAVSDGVYVRRLTPLECERLQGMPDNYTQIPWRGKPAEQCPDTPRYRAIGNSMAVPVMRWIGQRIKEQNGMARLTGLLL